MLYRKLKFLCLLSFLSFLVVSCSKETEDIVSENSIANTQQQGNNGQNNNGPNNNGPGNNNGNNNNGPNNNQGNGPTTLAAEIDNTITIEWMNLFLEIERYAGGMRPNASARAIAYINLAAYETAVPAMPDYVSNSRQLQGLNIQDNINEENIDWEVALNACYADVLSHFLLNVPAEHAAKISTLEEDFEEELVGDISNQSFNQSKDWGKRVARQIIRYSQSDEDAEEQVLEPQPLSYEPPTGLGYWTYSAEPERALFPYWESVRTFATSPDETTTVAPLAYSTSPGSAYFQEMMEVYNANNDARTADGEQLWIAEFWSDDIEGLMFSPPARQVSIANQLIANLDLNMEDGLHLLLKLGFSLNDAAVSTWKYKYEHMVMRPSVFIQEYIDQSYQTNLYRLIPWPNPTFPGYPSGHSAFASAAAGVFIDFFGNDINFTDRSHEGRTEFRGAARTFSTFEDMAAENGYSRIPLGVHIKIDCTEGLRLGYEISEGVNNYNVKRDPS